MIFLKTIWMEQFQLKLDWWLHCKICENDKKKKEMSIHKIVLFITTFFFVFLVFPFISFLSVNNLNGTIPTEIGLMTSLTQLWEQKKKREINFNFFFIFSFRLSFLYTNNLNTLPTEIGLMTSLSILWEKKKKYSFCLILSSFI